MDSKTTIQLFTFLVMIFYSAACLFLFMAKTKSPKAEIKIKRPSKSYKRFSSILQDTIDKSKSDMEKDEKFFILTGKKSSPFRKLKKSFIKTFSGGIFGPIIIRIFFVGCIISVGVFVVSSILVGPIIAALFTISTLVLSITAINVYKLSREVTIYEEVSTFLTINYSQYLSSATFEEAIDRTLDALRPGTLSYECTQRLRTRVVEYNIPLSRAVQTMKNEFMNLSHVEQYLDIVLKAESIDPSYKKSAGGISDNFSLLVKLKKDFTSGMVLLFGSATVMTTVAIGYTLLSSQTSKSFQLALRTPVGIALINTGVILLTIFLLIIYRATSSSIERVWDSEQ